MSAAWRTSPCTFASYNPAIAPKTVPNPGRKSGSPRAHAGDTSANGEGTEVASGGEPPSQLYRKGGDVPCDVRSVDFSNGVIIQHARGNGGASKGFPHTFLTGFLVTTK